MNVQKVILIAVAAFAAFCADAAVLREAKVPAAGEPVKPVPGEVLELPSFDGATLLVEIGKRSVSSTGVVTYGGRTVGSPLNNASLVLAGGGFVATLADYANGSVISVRLADGEWTLREESVPKGGKCGAERRSRAAAGGGKAAKVDVSRLTGNPLVDGAAIMKRGEKVTNVVDVLVGLDKSAGDFIRQKSIFAGLADAVGIFAADAIERCNNAYANTGLDRFFKFNLAGVIEIAPDLSTVRDADGYVDSTSLLCGLCGERRPSVAAFMKDFEKVYDRREETGADIVSFLVACGSESPNGTVGVGISLDNESIQSRDFPDAAYNVCLIEAVANDCTMAHEIGHNMGAGHAKMKDGDNSGPQLYDYSTGYYFNVTNADGNVFMHAASVMAYDSDGYDDDYKWGERWGWAPAYADDEDAWNGGMFTETPFFSSPDYTFKYADEEGNLIDSGVPVGDEKHDNTRLLSLTYPLAANYRVRKHALVLADPSGGAKSLSGAGSYAGGATAAIKATPADGRVFAGWYLAYDETAGYSNPLATADGADWRSAAAKATVAVDAEGRVVVYARFATKAEDSAGLSIMTEEGYETGRDGSFELVVPVESLSLPKLSVKGLPPGLKFDSRKNAVSGKATKPGVYTVSVSATNQSVKKAVTKTFTLAVPNLTTELFTAAGLEDRYVLDAGVAPDNMAGVFAAVAGAGWSLSVAGLPSGVKYDKKANALSGAATKAGISTATFTAAKKGEAKQVATATFEVVFPVLELAAAEYTEGSGAGGKVAGGGAYPAGKKVTLKATADKGSIFAGWYRGDELVSQQARYAYVTGDADVSFVAKFITPDEDAEAVSFSVDGVPLTVGGATLWTNWCGVAVNWPLASAGLSATTVKAAGLPSGVKLVQDKATKAYSLAGAPTVASKLLSDGYRMPSTTKFTVTTAGKIQRVFSVGWTILPLPDWAVGTFNGVVSGGEDALKRVPPEGLVQALTVAASGKISGKAVVDGGTWTLSASAFDSVDGSLESEAGSPRFRATVVGKNGKLTSTNEVTVAKEEVGVPDSGDVAGEDTRSPRGVATAAEWTAWQNLWKTEPWKTVAKAIAKAPQLVTEDGVSLKFAASGAVTAKYQGYSCSTVLIPVEGNEYEVFLYFPPKAGKFDGYSAELSLRFADGEFVVE